MIFTPNKQQNENAADAFCPTASTANVHTKYRMVVEPIRKSRPSQKQVKDVRNKLTEQEVKRLLNRMTAAGLNDTWPESVMGKVSEEQAITFLNEAVRTRIPATGRHGLIRCWCLFREKACASNNGVSYDEFKHATSSLGLPFPETLSKRLFERMDPSGTGTIYCRSFIDVIMRRWDSTSTSIPISSESADSVQNDPGSKEAVEARRRDPTTLVTELAKFSNKSETNYALGLLKQKIVATLGNGAKSGVMKMWTDFRRRCCATLDGVTMDEFKTGLEMYGISVSADTAVDMFTSIDKNNSGNIQIFEFIDNLMGRWDAVLHSLPGVGAEEEKLITGFAEQIAAANIDREIVAEQKKQIAATEARRRLHAKKIRETPIWQKNTAANSTRFQAQAAARSASAKSLRRSKLSEKVLKPLMRPAISVERIHYPGDAPAPSWSDEGQREQQQRTRKNMQRPQTTGIGTTSSKWEPPWWDQTERQRAIKEEQERCEARERARKVKGKSGTKDAQRILGSSNNGRRPSTSRSRCRRPSSVGGSRSGSQTPLDEPYVGEEFDLMRAIS